MRTGCCCLGGQSERLQRNGVLLVGAVACLAQAAALDLVVLDDMPESPSCCARTG